MYKTPTHNEPDRGSDRVLQGLDEVTALRRQLGALVKEIRRTIADPARPDGLKEVLKQSQMLLR